MVVGLGLDTSLIKAIESVVIDQLIHLTGGVVFMGIILVTHPGDIITIITIILLI